MKFKKGNWFLQDGIELVFPDAVRDITVENNKITCYAPCRFIKNQANTVDGPMLTYEFSSPMTDIIRVKVYHFKGSEPFRDSFDFVSKENVPMKIIENEEYIVASSGDTVVRISKQGPISYDFLYKGKLLTTSAPKSSCYVKSDKGDTHIREQLDLAVGECVYGLGERFTNFVKNGQSLDMWNDDSGTNSDMSYKNVPFYLTDNNYGVFVNNSGRVSYELCTQRVDKVQFSVPYEGLEYFVIGGESMKAVIDRYTTLTGKPGILPKWSYGLWLSTSFSTDYSEAIVGSMVERMKEEDIPLSVMHYDCFWMKEMEWCNFTWDERIFPNPKEMLKKIKANGLKVCVWINPYIAQKSPLFDECMEKGYFIKKEDGHIFQREQWQAGLGIIDFTNPEATVWYKEQLRNLIRMGVDTFKTDFGERIPSKKDQAVYYNGADANKMRNYYAYIYNKVVQEVLEEKLGEGQGVLFARAGTAGCQTLPVHWGGDCWSNFQAMAETLRGGLSLGLCGFGYWSHDIGGFEDHAAPEVYKRWVAFGLLSSHSRLHGSTSYRVPWHYDEESVDVLRTFTKLKNRLMPYIYAKGFESSDKGLSVIRPMILEYQDDFNCKYLDTQYMLGDKLLVAPIFNSESLARYYLPKGSWVNLMTRKTYEGGQWISEVMGYEEIPLMMKENTVLFTGNVVDTPEYDYIKDLTLNIYKLQDDFYEIVKLGNEKPVEVTVSMKDGTLHIEGPITLKEVIDLGLDGENVSFIKGGKVNDN